MMTDVDRLPENSHSETAYANTEVLEIEQPLINLCRQLEESFRNGEYSLIIGDDTSARIPTLVIRGFANYIRRQVGEKEIPTQFIDFSKNKDVMEIVDQVKERTSAKIPPDGKKALLVTEWVSTGETVHRAVSILSRNHINADTATLGTSIRYQVVKPPLYDEITLFSGGLQGTPAIYQNPTMSGLIRENGNIGEISPVAKKFKGYQKWVNESRGDIQLLIQTIIKQTQPVSQAQKAT